KRDDGIDLGDDDARAHAAKRLRAAFADIAIAGHDRDLARDHDARRALDAVDERFTTAIQVVELRLGDRVVDVDGRDLERALLVHLVEAVNARRRLFGQADDAIRTVEEMRE